MGDSLSSDEAELTFQTLVSRLGQFWAEQGCVIWQPYHTEVGAGTMNPATVLRVLGPEPWRVGYVEPSIRPDDSRFGENPNRMGLHYQYQVILKPDPGDPQELYLESLRRLGIDPRRHDIRFVEDNWESPALGAWGLGWEVWLDGQEITQFTYFQQAGGIPLDPPSVEITYGIERILMTLQGADHFSDIRWNDQFSYGDLNMLGEREYSRYYFEIADVERLWEMFEEYEAEAISCLEAGLMLPAHDYVLKCSHTFNILDTRGAIGVTERAGLFGRMRDLARGVSEAYLEHRQELGYPGLVDQRDGPSPETGVEPDLAQASSAADLVIEIGTEELPAGDLGSAIEQLRNLVPELLLDRRLEHGRVSIQGTPRRLVVHIADLEVQQKDSVMVVKGPPANRAYDEAGDPTAAAIGFAKSKGVSVGELAVEAVDGGEYVTARVTAPGLPAAEVLSEAIPELIANLSFEKAMRWNSTAFSFSRPIRWLMALHGETVIPFECAGLRTDRETRSLRFHDPERLTITSASDYFAAMAEQGIILDVSLRESEIREQIDALAQEVGGEVPEDPELLREVTNLVARPRALLGDFDQAFLELPPQVLMAVMKKHQRYFPVWRDGELLPHFIAVRNGDDQHIEVVRQGNEQVIRARFTDAAYFIQQDLKRPLAAYLPDLARLTFQTELGSMLDKVQRVQRLVANLALELGLNDDEREVALAAARLCKADLVTQMVVEMTSLQGEMGRYYALESGEPPQVAQAIYEHYLPQHSGDELPESPPGEAVAVADRLDTLMGLFAVGLQPTGAKDPFALRRAAIGLVQILVAAGGHFDLRTALKVAGKGLPVGVPAHVREDCLEFIAARQRALLRAEGHQYDAVDAVLAEQKHDPASAQQAVKDLETWIARPDWPRILQAYSRCARITRDVGELDPVDPELMVETETRDLYLALQAAQGAEIGAGSVADFLDAFEPIIPAISEFFDEVLVMAEEDALRCNRLALLGGIVSLADGIVDLSHLEGF